MIARKVILLIGEVLKLANRLLPKKMNVELQLLPDLLRSASEFETISSRNSAASAIYQLASLNRTLYRSWNNGLHATQRPSTEEEKRGQRQVEQVKLKLNLNTDDAHFRALIIDTQVH